MKILERAWINGVPCNGSRLTTTTPIGERGNDLPMARIGEQWVSRDLGIMMLHIVESEETGHTVTEVTDLVQYEPDASVFPGARRVLAPGAHNYSHTQRTLKRQFCTAA
jgi:hypothetical protein